MDNSPTHKRSLTLFIAKISFLVLLLGFFTVSNATDSYSPNFNLAIFYGDNPPLDKLQSYKAVAFEPSSGVNPRTFQTDNRKAYAYVAVGEITSLQQYPKAPPIPKNWVIGRNNVWKAMVVNVANPGWQKYFLDYIVTPAWEKGYSGFLLDTMDSYQLVAKTRHEKRAQQAGLIQIVKEIKTKYPGAVVI
jgi:hypothetical protein